MDMVIELTSTESIQWFILELLRLNEMVEGEPHTTIYVEVSTPWLRSELRMMVNNEVLQPLHYGLSWAMPYHSSGLRFVNLNVVGLIRNCVEKRGGTTGVLNQRASEKGERERTGYVRPEIHRDTALRHRRHE